MTGLGSGLDSVTISGVEEQLSRTKAAENITHPIKKVLFRIILT